MEGTLSLLLKSLLLKNNHKLDFKELELQLLSHPSYPSLYAVTGVLQHFEVENMALKVPIDIETFKQLPVTFLSIVNGHELVLVEKLHARVKLVFQGTKKPKILGDQDFLKQWNGTVVGVEEGTSDSTEGGMGWHELPKIFALISALILMGLFVNSFPDLFQSIHFFAGLVGLFISTLIVRHELGSQSGLMNRFCNANNATSCDAILQSKGATVFNLFKLSDVCLVYFSVTTLAWILYAMFGYYGDVFSAISLLALPAVFYSVYYQFKVVKKWCPLCLGISGVLLLQALSILFMKEGWLLKFSASETLILFFSAISIITTWAFLKPLLFARREFVGLQVEHYKIKRNFDLFQAAHSMSTPYSTVLSNLNEQEIILGNPSARISLLLVTSPLCIYCKAAHGELGTLLNRYPDDICLTIRFNTLTDDTTNMGFKVAHRLSELFLSEGGSSRFLEALDAAYEDDVQLESWLDNWGENDDENTCKALLEEQKQWCVRNQIHFTPALILNGREYPKEYQRTDLVHFIDELLDVEPILYGNKQDESIELALKD